MTPNEVAAWEVHRVLTDLEVPYAIIGGIAVQYWGEARFTQDVDLTVMLPVDEQNNLLQAIVEHLTPRLPDALEFARRNRILLVQTIDGFPIDISLALPGYEDEVMKRRVEYVLDQDKVVHVCSAEDLILHKAVAGRPQDLRDIEGIVIRQGTKLDLTYLRHWLQNFAAWLETDEVIERFEQPWQKHQPI